ncbi:phospholipase A2 group XV-like isoform X3 [Halichondria panicea]
MGSQLQVKDQTASKLCSTGHKYKDLWISPLRVTLHNICAKRELPLRYDANTNSYHNNTKVEIHVPGFGGTSSVEYLNPGLMNTLPYFHDTVKYFVDRSYKRGKTIRGAERLAADELDKRGYFHRLKTMIEDMYKTNGNTKVTLVVHSMGGLVFLHFLTGFSGINQAWKDKYIHVYVTLSAAWSGGAATVQSVISGYHGIPDLLLFAYNLISNFIVPIGRTFESIPWLFPKASVFGNVAFISTPSKTYSANDYEQLFRDINAPNIYRAFQGVQGLVSDYPAPNVPTYCFYGVGVPTPEKFTYSKDLTPSNAIGL